jgi:hypothetical protein
MIRSHRFLWLASYDIVYYLSQHNRGPNRTSHKDSFDEKYGADTGGSREVGTPDVVHSPAARYAMRYDPSSAEAVLAQLDKLQIKYAQFTFIDFGSRERRAFVGGRRVSFQGGDRSRILAGAS